MLVVVQLYQYSYIFGFASLGHSIGSFLEVKDITATEYIIHVLAMFHN